MTAQRKKLRCNTRESRRSLGICVVFARARAALQPQTKIRKYSIIKARTLKQRAGRRN